MEEAVICGKNPQARVGSVGKDASARQSGPGRTRCWRNQGGERPHSGGTAAVLRPLRVPQDLRPAPAANFPGKGFEKDKRSFLLQITARNLCKAIPCIGRGMSSVKNSTGKRKSKLFKMIPTCQGAGLPGTSLTVSDSSSDKI